MTPLPVLVLGIGIVRYQSIGYWVLGVQLGIVLTLVGRVCIFDCNIFDGMHTKEVF